MRRHLWCQAVLPPAAVAAGRQGPRFRPESTSRWSDGRSSRQPTLAVLLPPFLSPQFCQAGPPMKNGPRDVSPGGRFQSNSVGFTPRRFDRRFSLEPLQAHSDVVRNCFALGLKLFLVALVEEVSDGAGAGTRLGLRRTHRGLPLADPRGEVRLGRSRCGSRFLFVGRDRSRGR